MRKFPENPTGSSEFRVRADAAFNKWARFVARLRIVLCVVVLLIVAFWTVVLFPSVNLLVGVPAVIVAVWLIRRDVRDLRLSKALETEGQR